MKARMMISPISGSASISRWKLGARHPDDAAVLPVTPLTRISRLLNRSSSPVNWRSPWMWMILSAVRDVIDDLDRSLHHHVEVHAALAAVEQLGALGVISLLAEPADAVDMAAAELGKVLRLAPVGVAGVVIVAVPGVLVRHLRSPVRFTAASRDRRPPPGSIRWTA
jgi:hypothetical protein